MKKILSATIFALTVSVSAFAQNGETVSADPGIQNIDRILSRLEKDGMNGVILIRSRDKVLLHKAYGFADREKNRRMKTTTGFDIGSLVKSMTAAGILKLEEQGKLSTADPLSRFFPSAPEDKKNITIAQLLSHTSGMADMFGKDYDVVSRDWLEEKALTAALVSAPGEKRLYSNSGYSLLAVIIEKVSGKSYEKFIREEVFKPAGVGRIGYVLAKWKTDDLAVGYWEGKRWGSPLDKKWAEDGPSWNLRGNGGMIGTVAETSRWYEALLDGKILRPGGLGKYLANSSGVSKSLGERIIALAGGNDVFNSFQMSVIASDFHLTFFTSNAKFEAEKIFPDFRDDVVALVKASAAAK
jgi:CubicO group peptidase (beta-lactamase class C family)